MARFEPGTKYERRVYGHLGDFCGTIEFNDLDDVMRYSFYPIQDEGTNFGADTLRQIADALDTLNGNGKNGG